MKAHLLKAAAAAIVLFVVHQTAFAQWQSLTLPSQAPVSAIAVYHGDIYASLGGILYRSTDNGGHWALDTANGLHGLQVTALQPDGDNLVAGTNKTVFISSDDGGSWLDLIAGFLYDFTTSSLSVDSNVIIAATDSGGMAVTTDLGLSWNSITNHVYGISGLVNDMALKGGKFYIATNIGVSQSLDSGADWAAVNNGLWNNGFPFVSAVAADGNYLFIGTTLGRGIYYSTDDGADWTATQSAGMGYDSHGKMRTVNRFLASGNKLFAGTKGGGIYVSENYGANWVSANNGLTDTNILAMTATATDIFVGTEKGMWRRTLSEISSVNQAETAVPSAFELQQNFPNPFSSESDIAFSVKDASLYGKDITLQVSNAEGKTMQTAYNGKADGIQHIIHFDGSTLPSGSYYYRLQCGGMVISKTMDVIH
jgi:ligand-binding sensor domain-containing protein